MDAAPPAGAGLMRRYRATASELDVRRKGRADFVSEADLRGRAHACASACSGRSLTRLPDRGERRRAEPTRPRGSSSTRSTGPRTFCTAFPTSPCRIALEAEGPRRGGVVFDPAKDEMFVAERGGCMAGRGAAARVARPDLSRGARRHGHSPREWPRRATRRTSPMLEHRDGQAAGIRRLGAAALDWPMWPRGAAPRSSSSASRPGTWRPGALLVTEAGGRVTDIDGGDGYLESGEVLATNGRLHARMLAMLRDGRVSAQTLRRLPLCTSRVAFVARVIAVARAPAADARRTATAPGHIERFARRTRSTGRAAGSLPKPTLTGERPVDAVHDAQLIGHEVAQRGADQVDAVGDDAPRAEKRRRRRAARSRTAST